jgi:hypothetical protein
MQRDDYDIPQVVTTDLLPSTLTPTLLDFASGAFTSGIAVVGDVDVRLFRSMTATEQRRILPLLDAVMAEAEKKAIAEYAAPSTEAAQEVASLNEQVRRSARLEVAQAVTATRLDGAGVFYMELQKDYQKPMDCPLLARFGVTVMHERSADLRIASTSAEIVCEKFVSRVPLAIVERRGKQCWIAYDSYYEGFRYVLARPAQWVDDSEYCDLE